MKVEAIKIKTALIGLGSVNRNLLTILHEKRDRLRDQYSIEFEITCVADSSGVGVNDAGLNPLAIRDHKAAGNAVSDLSEYRQGETILDILNKIDIDLVFETSPVDLKSGGVGLSICRTALARSIPVVLANKAPLVLAFDELQKLSKKNNAALKYSATVCGGLPILNIGNRDLVCGDINKLQGIFNSTSNYILDSMANGETYDAALSEAQERGIAEADPSLDVGGWDTANKLLIIANTIMDANITLSDIVVEGIENIDPTYVATQRAKGNAVKLVAMAEGDNFSVRPTVLPQSEFLSQCIGWEMAVELHTDIYGIAYFKLWEREPIPTAGSMLRDAIHIFSSGNSEVPFETVPPRI